MTRALVVSASASVRVERALGFLGALPRDAEVLVLGPSRAAVDELLFADAARRGATFGLHRKTLPGLAIELAAPALAREGIAAATRLVFEAVTREVLAEALAAGTIPVLARRPLGHGSAADGPSFPAALASTITDLRMNGVEPSRLGSTEAVAEVGRLYAGVMRLLERRRLADRADLLRAAAAVARSGGAPALPLLFLDPTLTSNLERELFGALVDRSPLALVLCHDRDRRSLRHLAELRFAPERATDSAPLATFCDRLLSPESAVCPPEGRPPVTLEGAASEALEAVEVARAIVGEARRGVPFDAMAVAVRARDTYAAHLEAALARAGVPAFFEGGTRRPHPAGRALLLLLACRTERGSGRRLCEYLATAQVPLTPAAVPEEPLGPLGEELGRFAAAPVIDTAETALEAEPPTPDRPSIRGWERLLGEAGVVSTGPAETLTSYVSRRLAASRAVLEDVRRAYPDLHAEAPARARAERDATAIDGLLRALRPILEALDALPLRGSWGEMLHALRVLAARGLRRPALVLAVLADLEPLAASEQEVDLELVRVTLEPRLATLERPAPRSGAGRVLVTTPEALRGRVRTAVFVPGLAERLFPERAREDPLLSDVARAALSEDLDRQEDRAHAERLGLALAAGAATDRLAFSYPRFDLDAGRPRVPSLFALEVVRALEGALPDLASLAPGVASGSGARVGFPAPRDPEVAIDSVERELAFLGEHRATPEASRGRARILLVGHPHVHRALRARWARHRRDQLSPTDGLVATQPQTRARLARYRLRTRPASPSALATYSECPYRYFLHAIVHLTPRPDPSVVESLDPVTLGALHHACQALLVRRVAESGVDPTDPRNAAHVRHLAKTVVAELAADARSRLDPLLDSVFERDVQALERDVLGAVDRETASGDGFLPLYAELGFGLEKTTLDPRSLDEPARLPGGFLLRGAIDRVDRRPSGEVRVTDFKTGRLPDVRGLVGVGGGRLTQPLLYALALESVAGKLLDEGDRVTVARFFYSTERAGFEVQEVDLAPDNKARGLRVLEIVDRAIERALLPALPREGACARCPYQAVCGPDEERRARRKRLDRPDEKDLWDDLVALRGLP